MLAVDSQLTPLICSLQLAPLPGGSLTQILLLQTRGSFTHFLLCEWSTWTMSGRSATVQWRPGESRVTPTPPPVCLLIVVVCGVTGSQTSASEVSVVGHGGRSFWTCRPGQRTFVQSGGRDCIRQLMIGYCWRYVSCELR